MNVPNRTFLGFALTAIAAGGCNGGAGVVDPAEAQVAADGTEAMTASSQSIDLTRVVFESVSVDDPLLAAAQLVQPAHTGASACLTREKDPDDPAVVHVTLHDCTGPFGLVHIDGEEVVALSAGKGGALRATVTGIDLVANGRPMAFAATADITFPTPTTRSVVWQGSFTRGDATGATVAHASDLKVTVDLTAGCSASSGSAMTTVANREVDSTVTDYALCRDAATGAAGCPSGTVVHTGRVSDRTVSVTFDTSDVAEVTGPRGNTFPVELVCTPIGR